MNISEAPQSLRNLANGQYSILFSAASLAAFSCLQNLCDLLIIRGALKGGWGLGVPFWISP